MSHDHCLPTTVKLCTSDLDLLCGAMIAAALIEAGEGLSNEQIAACGAALIEALRKELKIDD